MEELNQEQSKNTNEKAGKIPYYDRPNVIEELKKRKAYNFEVVNENIYREKMQPIESKNNYTVGDISSYEKLSAEKERLETKIKNANEFIEKVQILQEKKKENKEAPSIIEKKDFLFYLKNIRRNLEDKLGFYKNIPEDKRSDPDYVFETIKHTKLRHPEEISDFMTTIPEDSETYENAKNLLEQQIKLLRDR